MKNTKVFLMAIFALLLFTASSAHAVLTAVGPVNPANGWPKWYMDENGIKLRICSVPAVCPATTPTEQFYYNLVAVDNTTTPGVVGKAIFALEASYLTPVPVPGRQIVFNRMRFTVKGLAVEGPYTIDHPYGTTTVNVVLNPRTGLGQIKFTQDIGIAPRIFNGALAGTVGPFLSQITHRPRFLGNAAIQAPINPGPNGDTFTVTDPNGTVVISQNLWAVGGQLF